MSLKKTVLCIIIFSVVLFTLTACGDSKISQEHSRDFFAMNTYITISAYGEHTEESIKSAENRIRELEGMWSVTDTNSEIYAVNHSDSPIEITSETADLISFALDIFRKTDGALEPTIFHVFRHGDLQQMKIICRLPTKFKAYLKWSVLKKFK